MLETTLTISMVVFEEFVVCLGTVNQHWDVSLTYSLLNTVTSYSVMHD